ncbi:glycoside-pentoside-hexuronide (GPH):cation symporter [Neobacillus cucumis]|uniref:MFS transporter n=1 Tax=Neobacillus cucumis TaxID=1740721 RepID=UPI002E1EAAD6|nr:glycoside-pentoside-hexuronide (GPH):cation symporter [Neobacillus cucumis]MED4224489.1 glycoside-pentoside-hexuronide (GPH):cation symporter [Neobacillus cucumis]
MRPFGIRDKFGYLFGDFGNDFSFTLVSAYLMVFYTDVFHISAATVGALFFGARLWDAFADIATGRLLDILKPTKGGKFKPWIFRMSIPLLISFILMFWKIPGMSDGFYLAWAFVTYIVWGTFYSTVNIPYGSMASVITNDSVERTSLSTWRTLGATLAGLFINSLAPLIVFVDNKLDANRLFMITVLFAVLAMACYIACVKLSTERITAEKPSEDKPKIKFSTTLKGLGKNRPLITILAASLLLMVNNLLSSTINVYLFKNYFNNAAALSLVGLIQAGTVFLGGFLVSSLVKKFGKKEIASAGLLLAGAIYILLYLLPNVSAIQFVWVSAVGAFGFGIFNLTIWAFVTDVIDYQELLTNNREDGTIYSIYTFSRKIGLAIAGGIGGVALAAVGYDATKPQQSQAVLDSIHMVGTLVPGALYLIIALIILFLYPLNKKRVEQLVKDMAEKKNKVA